MDKREVPRTFREILEILVAIFVIIGVIFGIYEFVFPGYILDCDRDDVHDYYDACENPGCSIIDSSGCPKDSNVDGIRDCDDACRLLSLEWKLDKDSNLYFLPKASMLQNVSHMKNVLKSSESFYNVCITFYEINYCSRLILLWHYFSFSNMLLWCKGLYRRPEKGIVV